MAAEAVVLVPEEKAAHFGYAQGREDTPSQARIQNL